MSGLEYRSFPVVLSAPSGTGKTTLARALVERFDVFCFSISATTREPRGRERDGEDYHFVDRARFEAMVSDGELAEWAEVHGELYGTLKAELDSAAERGEHVVLDIDVQGARQIRQSVPEAVLVFLLPPSVEVLLQRLRGRGTEEKVQVARRLQTAMDELQAAGEFDHVVVNDDFDRCLGSIRGIVESEALRSTRAPGLEDTVEEMRDRLGSVLQSDSVNATR